DGASCGPTPEQWSFCADENGSCAFTGTKRVRFGKDGKYSYKIADGAGGAVPCTSANFGGDPIPNTFKGCQISYDLYTACAAENATCSFTGTKEVRFGANGQWATTMASGSIACAASAFGGDPLPNVVKTCEYR